MTGRRNTPRPAGWVNPAKGKPNGKARPLAERFWAKVDKRPDGCWQWLGAQAGKDPRGAIWSGGANGQVLYAHRVSLELHGRGPVPADMQVDHICRNGLCVNPDHLRIVTPRVNATENNDSPFAVLSRATHCRYGHPWNAENTVWLLRPNEKTRHGHLKKSPRPYRACIACRPYYANSMYRVDPPTDVLMEGGG